MIPKNCHLWQKDNLTRQDLDLEVIETIEESSHFERFVMRCKRCGQLYFYEFYEIIDWDGGDDKIYVTYIPVKKKDIEELKTKTSFELLDYSPRLQWDTHGKNADNLIWIDKKDDITGEDSKTIKRKMIFAECEECDFAVKFKHSNETFFFCKEHKFGVNVPDKQLDDKYICKFCKKEMERYDLDVEDNVCPVCEAGILSLCYTAKDLPNE